MNMDELKHSDVIANVIVDHGYKKIVEIGVWLGWMTQRVLGSKASSMITEYWTVDPWAVLTDPGWRSWTKISGEEWDRKHFEVCRLMCRFPQLKVVKMLSVVAATMFPDNYFDLVYIDGDHRYNAVKADIEAWLPKVRPGGTIAGHDYLLQNRKRRSLCEVKPAVDDFFGTAVIEKPYKVWTVQR